MSTLRSVRNWVGNHKTLTATAIALLLAATAPCNRDTDPPATSANQDEDSTTEEIIETEYADIYGEFIGESVDESQDYRTHAHEFLDLESDLGTTDEDYGLLDSIIDQASARIRIKDTYTKADAIEILETIDSVLDENGIHFVGGGYLFNNVFKTGEADCDQFSFLYLAVRDELDLPIVLSKAPHHVFVRWVFDDGEYINWEASAGKVRSDANLISHYNLAEETISNGIYLSNLTDAEIFALEYKNICNALDSKDQDDKAIEACTTSIELNPRDPMVYNNRAKIYSENRYFIKSIEDLTKAIELDPEYVMAYSSRGITWFKSGYPDKGIADLNQAIALDPDYAHAYHNRGYVFSEIGEFDNAIRDLDKAIELEPDIVNNYLIRAFCWREKKEYEKAIEDYDTTIELTPEDYKIYNRRGIVFARMGENDKALDDYDKALELNPKSHSAYSNRAIVLVKEGRLDEAIEDYNTAIELKPIAPHYNNRGIVWAEKGQHERAIEDFDKAITLNPNYVQAYHNRGNSAGEIGDHEQKEADYAKAEELGIEL